MSLKAKLPEEDPETVARREAAEQRAESGRIEEAQENLTNETLQIIRQFGRISNQAGQSSLVPGNNPINKILSPFARQLNQAGGLPGKSASLVKVGR